MRKILVLAVLAAGIVTAGASAYFAPRHDAPAAPPVAAPAPAPAPPTVEAPAAPAPEPPAASAAAPSTPPTPQIADGSDLPTVAVVPHAIHPVPDQADPPPAPMPSSSFAAPPPVPRRDRGPLPSSFSGWAQPLGGVTLSLLGRSVRLFGVQAPGPRDVCPLPAGPAQPCSDVARNVLSGRLGSRPSVTCHSPPGQRGVPGFICRDAAGTDLAGLLVAQGLALADTRQSYQYFDAQGAARKARLGLWRYR